MPSTLRLSAPSLSGRSSSPDGRHCRAHCASTPWFPRQDPACPCLCSIAEHIVRLGAGVEKRHEPWLMPCPTLAAGHWAGQHRVVQWATQGRRPPVRRAGRARRGYGQQVRHFVARSHNPVLWRPVAAADAGRTAGGRALYRHGTKRRPCGPRGPSASVSPAFVPLN